MTTLEERIHFTQGHLIEFMSSASIKTIEHNAYKKAGLITTEEKIDSKLLSLAAKAIKLYDMTHLFKGVWQDNYQRSAKDITRTLRMDNNTINLWFPKEDKFFREGYKNPMYGISGMDDKEIKEAVKEYKTVYLKAIAFWSENEH